MHDGTHTVSGNIKQWSDAEVEQAAQKLKEAFHSVGYDSMYIVEEFLPEPLKDALKL